MDPSLVSQLAELGFTAHQAKYALKEQGNNLESAANWLIANADKVPKEECSGSLRFCGFFNLHHMVSASRVTDFFIILPVLSKLVYMLLLACKLS